MVWSVRSPLTLEIKDECNARSHCRADELSHVKSMCIRVNFFLLRRMKLSRNIVKSELSSKVNVLVVQSCRFASSYICRHAPRIDKWSIALRGSLRSHESGQASLLLVNKLLVLEATGFAMDVTLFECNAMKSSRIVAGAGHELRNIRQKKPVF